MVIIKTGVFIYNYLVAYKQINSFLFSELEIYVTNIRNLILKSGTVATLALTMLKYFKAALPASILGTLVAAVTVTIASSQLNCSDFVRKLPQTNIERGTTELPVQTAVFLNDPPRSFK